MATISLHRSRRGPIAPKFRFSSCLGEVWNPARPAGDFSPRCAESFLRLFGTVQALQLSRSHLAVRTALSTLQPDHPIARSRRTASWKEGCRQDTRSYLHRAGTQNRSRSNLKCFGILGYLQLFSQPFPYRDE